MFDYLRMPLTPHAGFVMDGQSFGVFTHDWLAALGVDNSLWVWPVTLPEPGQ
ncbi:MAG: hypothetical protein IPM39_24565 [Chloroflexi bacterium]|nr:hypothetical protein [Chloroflexota bacterium]